MINHTPRVFVGYDAREWLAYQVCTASLLATASKPVSVEPIGRSDLVEWGVYNRTQSERDGLAWDDLSDAPCSTDFSLARFWLPSMAPSSGWALYCDCDFLWRRDVRQLFALADARYAVMVVPHQHAPAETTKMDGQAQTVYRRKNWSSLMLFNLAHAGTRRLMHGPTGEANTRPGRDLHAFCWLKDSEIGFLPEEWNWLDGSSDIRREPAAVHFTRGTPDMPGWERTPYASEWNRYAAIFVDRAQLRKAA